MQHNLIYEVKFKKKECYLQGLSSHLDNLELNTGVEDPSHSSTANSEAKENVNPGLIEPTRRYAIRHVISWISFPLKNFRRMLFLNFWPVGGSSAETPHSHFGALILYDLDQWGAPQQQGLCATSTNCCSVSTAGKTLLLKKKSRCRGGGSVGKKNLGEGGSKTLYEFGGRGVSKIVKKNSPPPI